MAFRPKEQKTTKIQENGKVMHRRATDGLQRVGTVVGVHSDDVVRGFYYTVHLAEDGQELQTNEDRLTSISESQSHEDDEFGDFESVPVKKPDSFMAEVPTKPVFNSGLEPPTKVPKNNNQFYSLPSFTDSNIPPAFSKTTAGTTEDEFGDFESSPNDVQVAVAEKAPFQFSSGQDAFHDLANVTINKKSILPPNQEEHEDFGKVQHQEEEGGEDWSLVEPVPPQQLGLEVDHEPEFGGFVVSPTTKSPTQVEELETGDVLNFNGFVKEIQGEYKNDGEGEQEEMEENHNKKELEATTGNYPAKEEEEDYPPPPQVEDHFMANHTKIESPQPELQSDYEEIEHAEPMITEKQEPVLHLETNHDDGFGEFASSPTAKVAQNDDEFGEFQ